MAEYRLSPAAANDLDGIFRYTLQQWGLEQAIRYTQAMEKVCSELAETPTRAPECSHIRPGYRRGVADRHFVYFQVEDYGIAVIRILHQQMDAPRHI